MLPGRYQYQYLLPLVKGISGSWKEGLAIYSWLKRYQSGGIDGLEDRKPCPRLVWNKLPEDQQAEIIKLALDKPELSPRELAVTYIDEQFSFVSESTVYRLLKAHDLILEDRNMIHTRQTLSSIN
jgi:hypothetical protein